MYLKKKSQSKQKGITLIALVITIIVMLILVAVTSQVATNGNLFKHAGNAVKETKNAVLQENYLGEGRIQIGGVAYNSIEEYIATQTGESGGGSQNTNLINFTIDERQCNAVNGMTWTQWVSDTNYNTYGFYISGSSVVYRYTPSLALTVKDASNNTVLTSSTINAGASYHTISIDDVPQGRWRCGTINWAIGVVDNRHKIDFKESFV